MPGGDGGMGGMDFCGFGLDLGCLRRLALAGGEC